MGKIIDKLPLNWALLSNPVNWVMVWVMVALGYAALQLINSQIPQPHKDK